MNRRKRQKVKSDPLKDFKDKVRQHDYKSSMAKIKSVYMSLPVFHRKAVTILVPLTLLLMVIPFPEFKSNVVEPSEPIRVELEIDTKGLSEQSSNSKVTTRNAQWQEYTVKSGDTLTQVFRSNDLNIADLNALAAIEGVDKPLSRIKTGQIIRYKLNEQDELDILQVERGDESVMFFRLSDGGFGRSK
jgi:cell envelope opacity-associated protein A